MSSLCDMISQKMSDTRLQIQSSSVIIGSGQIINNLIDIANMIEQFYSREDEFNPEAFEDDEMMVSFNDLTIDFLLLLSLDTVYDGVYIGAQIIKDLVA